MKAVGTIVTAFLCPLCDHKSSKVIKLARKSITSFYYTKENVQN